MDDVSIKKDKYFFDYPPGLDLFNIVTINNMLKRLSSGFESKFIC